MGRYKSYIITPEAKYSVGIVLLYINRNGCGVVWCIQTPHIPELSLH